MNILLSLFMAGWFIFVPAKQLDNSCKPYYMMVHFNDKTEIMWVYSSEIHKFLSQYKEEECLFFDYILSKEEMKILSKYSEHIITKY